VRITITIDTDNAAWDDYPDQLERVMGMAIEHIDTYNKDTLSRPLYDRNGNNTGRVEFGERPR
jgi:hypothetical protein